MGITKEQLEVILGQLKDQQTKHDADSIATSYKIEGAIEIVTKIITSVVDQQIAQDVSDK